jgi:hypothetical protein
MRTHYPYEETSKQLLYVKYWTKNLCVVRGGKFHCIGGGGEGAAWFIFISAKFQTLIPIFSIVKIDFDKNNLLVFFTYGLNDFTIAGNLIQIPVPIWEGEK